MKIDLIDTDDEATESSSGGESADEQEKFAPTAASYAPIKERAKYRYLKKVCTTVCPGSSYPILYSKLLYKMG